MSDANLRQIRVLHIVSAGAVPAGLQQSLLMPLLTRLPRPRVKAQVACLSPGALPSAILRQNGVPVYDIAMSSSRFSFGGRGELLQLARAFRPDVIQAWGHTAQIVSVRLRKGCDWKPRLVWNVAGTTPLPKNAGFVDRQKLRYAAKNAARADHIVYASEAGASQHRRAGFPEGGHATIPPGVDATRFKPDFAARRKLREELSLPGETFVIGMVAPFQPEYDHATLIKGVGELLKTNPNVALVLAGHGVQKGNAPLMALLGSGALATHTHLLGEWSDVATFYNACDVVCSSALNDESRMNLVMAMLCGVPCVATGMGAQGEVIGQFGVAIEPGSAAAFVKGITRVMQLSPEKRTHMAQGARKHALQTYVYVRSLQKYLQLYYDLIGRESLVTQDLPTPEFDHALTVPPALPTASEMAAKKKRITVADLSDPDSLESKVDERSPEELPKWRREQEEERARREAELARQVTAAKSTGDILQVFETELAKQTKETVTPMSERARGVTEEVEELLPAELLTLSLPIPDFQRTGPHAAKPAGTAAVATKQKPDVAKPSAARVASARAATPLPGGASAADAKTPKDAANANESRAAPTAAAPAVASSSTRPPASAAASPSATPAPASAAPASMGEQVKRVTSASPATMPQPVHARTAEAAPATMPQPVHTRLAEAAPATMPQPVHARMAEAAPATMPQPVHTRMAEAAPATMPQPVHTRTAEAAPATMPQPVHARMAEAAPTTTPQPVHTPTAEAAPATAQSVHTPMAEAAPATAQSVHTPMAEAAPATTPQPVHMPTAEAAPVLAAQPAPAPTPAPAVPTLAAEPIIAAEPIVAQRYVRSSKKVAPSSTASSTPAVPVTRVEPDSAQTLALFPKEPEPFQPRKASSDTEPTLKLNALAGEVKLAVNGET